MNTPKPCPKCGKPLERVKFRTGYSWCHLYQFGAVLSGTFCDYSEPEASPRCPKRRKESAK